MCYNLMNREPADMFACPSERFPGDCIVLIVKHSALRSKLKKNLWFYFLIRKQYNDTHVNGCSKCMIYKFLHAAHFIGGALHLNSKICPKSA